MLPAANYFISTPFGKIGNKLFFRKYTRFLAHFLSLHGIRDILQCVQFLVDGSYLCILDNYGDVLYREHIEVGDDALLVQVYLYLRVFYQYFIVEDTLIEVTEEDTTVPRLVAYNLSRWYLYGGALDDSVVPYLKRPMLMQSPLFLVDEAIYLAEIE